MLVQQPKVCRVYLTGLWCVSETYPFQAYEAVTDALVTIDILLFSDEHPRRDVTLIQPGSSKATARVPAGATWLLLVPCISACLKFPTCT